jgi:hypothetical protein
VPTEEICAVFAVCLVVIGVSTEDFCAAVRLVISVLVSMPAPFALRLLKIL